MRYARHNRDRCVFHAAIRKYGEDAFDWTVLEFDIHTYDELNEREKYWIQEKNSRLPNGYNMNAGGNGTANHHQSEEVRKRISATLTGRRQSEETKRKIAAALKGKPLSEAHRMHLSEGRKGMVFTEEHRRHLSEARKGAKPWNRKSVLMYDQSGNFVMEFESVKAAADYIGDCSQNICKQLTGKRKSVRGYTFRYKNENPDR